MGGRSVREILLELGSELGRRGAAAIADAIGVDIDRGGGDEMGAADARRELGLPLEGELLEEQIRDAWRARARAVHPDRGGSSEAMRRATRARDLLLAQLP